MQLAESASRHQISGMSPDCVIFEANIAFKSFGIRDLEVVELNLLFVLPFSGRFGR